VHAIETQGLTKIYSSGITAVNQLDFTVDPGEIVGLLGPNGAGKSTTIMMLTTLLKPTAGTARIQGEDIRTHPNRVRQLIGYVSQDLAVDDNLTGRENLLLQARFYGLKRGQAQPRIAEVLALVNLKERIDDLAETYSGGMRKRLDIAGGLLHRPRVLFLDEPTLGLDVQTRTEIWNYIRKLREESGLAVLLTTHYMEEADRLCDRIAIIDRGRINASDPPDRLKSGRGGDRVTLGFASDGSLASAQSLLHTLRGVRAAEIMDNRLVLTVHNGETLLPRIFEVLKPLPFRIETVTVKRPSLDDVYLHFTGRALRDEEESSAEENSRRRIAMRRARR